MAASLNQGLKGWLIPLCISMSFRIMSHLGRNAPQFIGSGRFKVKYLLVLLGIGDFNLVPADTTLYWLRIEKEKNPHLGPVWYKDLARIRRLFLLNLAKQVKIKQELRRGELPRNDPLLVRFKELPIPASCWNWQIPASCWNLQF